MADGTIAKGRGRGGSANPPAAHEPSPAATKANGRNGGGGFEQVFKAIDDVL